MKIGEFATKYELSHDTVRYYMQIGLLQAAKKGGQYEFTPRECKDMEEIRQLKNLDFSLSEIQRILSYKRITGLTSSEEKDHYRSYFLSKQEELKSQEVELREKKASLTGIIKGLHSKDQEIPKSGFPIEYLKLLQCPCCHSPLSIEDGIITKTMVMEANIGCDCSYRAIIENGIYVDLQSIRPKIINGGRLPTKEEYVQNTSPKFINFLSVGIHKIQEKLLNSMTESGVILETGSCVGFFLSQIVKTLPEKTVYLLTDYDYDRVKNCKAGFEKGSEKLTFIYFACDLHRLPLANNSVDYIVDYVCIRHFGEQHQQFMPEMLIRLLKESGELIGTYHYFEEGSNGFNAISSASREYYRIETFMDNMERLPLEFTSKEIVGPVSEGGKYNAYVDGNDLYQMIYSCQKKQ